jgi:hypothetical protein
MIAFDMASSYFQNSPFEKRYTELLNYITTGQQLIVPPYIAIFFCQFFCLFYMFCLFILFASFMDTNIYNTKITAPRMLCKHSKHLKRMIDGIIDMEGEGVILRRVGSIYKHGKSPLLLKLKVCLKQGM